MTVPNTVKMVVLTERDLVGRLRSAITLASIKKKHTDGQVFQKVDDLMK